MKADWKDVGTEYLVDGEKNIFYANPDYPGIVIESRKRHIPHSGRSGYWMHTSFAVVTNAGEQAFMSLADAIRWVEDNVAREETNDDD